LRLVSGKNCVKLVLLGGKIEISPEQIREKLVFASKISF